MHDDHLIPNLSPRALDCIRTGSLGLAGFALKDFLRRSTCYGTKDRIPRRDLTSAKFVGSGLVESGSELLLPRKLPRLDMSTKSNSDTLLRHNRAHNKGQDNPLSA